MRHGLYTNNKTLTVYEDFNRRDGVTYRVAGKREARALCVQLAAKPWNF